MKILLLSTSMGMGGADKQLLSAAQEMRSRGHEILIVSLTALGPMGLEARASGLRTESLEMPRGVPDPRGVLRLVRIVREWRPDVVHSHMVHANLLARFLRIFAPVPVLVSTIHNVYEGGRLLMAGYRLTNGLADHMTAVSQAAADRFVRDGIVPKQLLTVIPNGVDTDRFQNVPGSARDSVRTSLGLGDEFVWMAVGRFEVAKDYPNMLRAFARVREGQKDAVLLLVGGGSLQGETEALTQSLGLTGAVRFLGMRPDVPELMSAADAYVMSSAWEGMPLVLLEAAAAGLPVVATLVGGNQEVVRHDETGLLVPPGDSDSLGDAMLRLMRSPETERRSMGRRGREYVQRQFRLGRVVDRWEEVYREARARQGLELTAPTSPASR